MTRPLGTTEAALARMHDIPAFPLQADFAIIRKAVDRAPQTRLMNILLRVFRQSTRLDHCYSPHLQINKPPKSLNARGVGGVVVPTSMFAVFAPYLAIIGLVAIGAAAYVKKRSAR